MSGKTSKTKSTGGPGMLNMLRRLRTPEEPRQEHIDRRRGLLPRMFLLAAAVMLVGQLAVAWLSVDGFEKELKPQLNQKIQLVGRAVAEQISFAVNDLGIPPGKLVGMDAFFDKVLAANPDIEYLILDAAPLSTPYARGLSAEDLAIVRGEFAAPAGYGRGHKHGRTYSSAAGLEVAAGGFTNRTFPVVGDGDGGDAGVVLHVGAHDEYVRGRLSEIIYDVVTVIVVSWLVTLEFLTFYMSARISGPMKRIEEALAGGAKGVFTHRLVMRSRDEIGRIVLSFNHMLRNLEQRYEDFHFESRELEGAQIDDSISRRIRGVRGKIEKQYSFGGEERAPRRAMQIRIPLFLFIFSEELSRSFLPLFIARLSPTEVSGATGDLLIGLPITLFMLAAALITMLGTGFADRFGARRVFSAGVVLVAAGFVGTFLVQSYYELVAWRILTGAGYGLAFIAAQAWVTENTGKDERAGGMTVFIGAVFVGAMCGPPIGGIFAERIGFETTFLVAAGIALVAALIVHRVLHDGETKTGTGTGTGTASESESGAAGRRTSLGAAGWWVLLRDIRFLAVTVFSAVPGKFILTGFLFYLVPLYLNDLGHSQSAIGRIMMLYGIATIACSALVARLADSSGRGHGQYARIIVVGGMLAALGCFAVLVRDDIGGAANAIIVATVLLGVSHGMSLTSQLAVIRQVADRHQKRIGMGRASVIGAYRLVERTGLVLGPVAAGVLVAGFGYVGAMVGIGIILAASMLLYMILMAKAEGTLPTFNRGGSRRAKEAT